MKEWQVKRVTTGEVFAIKAETIQLAFIAAREEAEKLGIPQMDLVITEYIGPKRGKCCGDKE